MQTATCVRTKNVFSNKCLTLPHELDKAAFSLSLSNIMDFARRKSLDNACCGIS